LEAAYETESAEAAYLLADARTKLDDSPEPILRELIRKSPSKAHEAYQRLMAFADHRRQWQMCLDLAAEMKAVGIAYDAQKLLGYRYEWIQAQPDLPPKKCIERYQQILKDAPDFAPASLALADTYMMVQAEEKAFRVYEHAFEQTRNPIFLDRIERYYLEQGRPEDAIQIYRQLLVSMGGPLIKFQLGKLYYKLEMLDDSLEILEPLRGHLGHLPGYLLCLADIKARRNRHDEATEDLKSLIQHRGDQGEDFVCDHCSAHYPEWQARCDQCSRWDRIRLEASLVKTEPVSTSPLYF
jgi:lipopolysaccharide biosynthesis regulator YciM